MKTTKIAVLTTASSWFLPYARRFVGRLRKMNFEAELFTRHEEIASEYGVVFILSYHRIIPKEYLSKHRHNIVVHGSALPKGTGWAPVFWQILEEKNRIPFTLFEAVEGADSGAIYLTDELILKGHELFNEIRKAQATKTTQMCEKFISQYDTLTAYPQKGKRTFYRKRGPADSELNINKSLLAQFAKLRIADNKNFPAFFKYRGHTYALKINKVKETKVLK